MGVEVLGLGEDWQAARGSKLKTQNAKLKTGLGLGIGWDSERCVVRGGIERSIVISLGKINAGGKNARMWEDDWGVVSKTNRRWHF